jgi:hypothetical protein
MHSVNDILVLGAMIYVIMGIALVFLGIALCDADRSA